MNKKKDFVKLKKVLLLGIFCIFSLNVFSQENFKSKGISSFYKKDYRNSIKYFNQAIEKGDSSYEVFYFRGLAKLYSNDFESALNDLTISIEKGGNTPDVFNNRGIIYLYLGDFKLAIDDFNKALELDSTFAEAYTNRATVNIEVGEIEDALVDLDKAIKYNPNNVSTYYERGRAFYKKKNYEEAIANFDKCIKLNLKNSKVYYNRGNAYFKLGKYKKAIEDYSKCLTLDSTDTEALNNRAVAYEKLGMVELAKKDRKKLARLLGNEDLFKPIEEITFVEITDSLGTFKVLVPSHWKIFQKFNNDYSEIVITPENIKSDTDYYSVGLKLSFNRNMSKLYNVRTPGEILEFWRGSIEKNAQEYYFYKYLQQKLFTRGEYSGNLYETLVQYWQNSIPFQCYELALTKEDALFFGFFQAPANQFSHFRLIFDKILNSIVLIK
ncbi:MAG: tetratricopeptide repeat protein [Ignavibacteria bacterium]|nr:tetratricopeptide repeat protein [Ignavibacteria bacterium]